MDILVISDTNIFIDLISIELLDSFFELPIVVHTNDFVINELSEGVQKWLLLTYAPSKLFIKSYSSKEVVEIVSFFNHSSGNLSLQDCSVWLYAKQKSSILLTGDARLRRSASADGVDVRGILYIFDMMVDKGVISPIKGCDKLEELSRINNRLPSQEINKRLEKWRGL